MTKEVLKQVAKALEKEKLITPSECLALEKLLESIFANEIYHRKQEQLQGKIDEHRKQMVQLEKENAKGSVL